MRASSVHGTRSGQEQSQSRVNLCKSVVRRAYPMTVILSTHIERGSFDPVSTTISDAVRLPSGWEGIHFVPAAG
jgi:hypothetical protein